MTAEQLAVLLVDDDVEEHIIIQDLVATISTVEITVDHVETFEEAVSAIRDDLYDVYLIDYRLGTRSGLDLIRDAIEGGCSRPLFLLTGRGDREVDIEASESGAAGYLEKGELDSVLLERTIRFSLTARVPATVQHRTSLRPGDFQLQIALARGATIRDAARAAGIGERTAHRRLTDPDFLTEVDQLREQLRSRVVDQVAAQLSDEQFGASQ